MPGSSLPPHWRKPPNSNDPLEDALAHSVVGLEREGGKRRRAELLLEQREDRHVPSAWISIRSTPQTSNAARVSAEAASVTSPRRSWSARNQ